MTLPKFFPRVTIKMTISFITSQNQNESEKMIILLVRL